MRHHFFVLLLLSKYHSLDVVRIDLAELLRCGCCVELLHYVRVRLLLLLWLHWVPLSVCAAPPGCTSST